MNSENVNKHDELLILCLIIHIYQCKNNECSNRNVGIHVDQ